MLRSQVVRFPEQVHVQIGPDTVLVAGTSCVEPLGSRGAIE